jgi:coatomer subunit epsilon
MLLQLIEASIDLFKGTNNYSNPYSFYTEQSHNPSLTSARLVAARGITRLLRGELKEAGTDFNEALKLDPNEVDALAANVALTWITGRADVEEAYE